MRSKLLLPLILIFFITSCKKEQTWFDPNLLKDLGLNKNHLKIAVVSDIHYMDPSLLKNGAAEGEAFQSYLAKDPKLLQLSDPILRQVIYELKLARPDLVLIPGDLTKDGEKLCHQDVAAFLQQLKNAGMKVYVVPGNHDVNNPEAAKYDGNSSTPVPSVSAAEFSAIYANFGYANALSRDPNSLSYVAQPTNGLWILGIDDCKYNENTNIAIVGGKIKPATMTWIQQRMAEAKKRNITVLTMMHHNLVEHYTGQSQFDPGYVTDDWEATSAALVAAGINVIFTGHYHANDITKRVVNGKDLYDIETGSLVTAPLPYRLIDVQGNDIYIATKRVTMVSSGLPAGVLLPTYANLFLSAHLDAIFSYLLTLPPFLIPYPESAADAPLFTRALMAHYAGDEKITPADQAKVAALATPYPAAAFGLNSLWTDLPVADNFVHITITP